MPGDLFLDTAYAIALAARSDEHHELAVSLAKKLEADGTRLVTTPDVMVEIGNSLAKQSYRRAAVELLESLEQDPFVEIVPASEELYQRAFELFLGRPDKVWGLTDCVPFVVMQDLGLTAALTTDEHFQQAGFQALLRPPP